MNRHPSLDDLFALVVLAIALVSACAWPVLARAEPSSPTDTCQRIAAETDRAGQLRRDAIDKGETAWRAVLPFAVIARKAASKAEAGQAERRLAVLDAEARREGCAVPGP
ncbi:MAG: hypothetical protein AB7O64_17860 [Methylibium sp.]